MVNAALGWKESVFDSFWQLWAVAIGSSILIAFVFPYLRGVRKGDKLLASVPRAHSTPAGVYAFVEQTFATALENGRTGQKIKLRLANGRTGEGIVAEYAGTFGPHIVQVTETEIG